jgi:hypothetical protein
MIDKKIILEWTAHLVQDLAFCGPIRVSCCDGKKRETREISGWDREKAEIIVAQAAQRLLESSTIGLQIQCEKCGKILTRPGALIFSPPDMGSECKKTHLCSNCYDGQGGIMHLVHSEK